MAFASAGRLRVMLGLGVVGAAAVCAAVVLLAFGGGGAGGAGGAGGDDDGGVGETGEAVGGSSESWARSAWPASAGGDGAGPSASSASSASSGAGEGAGAGDVLREVELVRRAIERKRREGAWVLESARGELPGDLLALRGRFEEVYGEDGAAEWLRFCESVSAELWSRDPETASNILAVVGHRWSDEGELGEAMRVWREVAARGVASPGTVNAYRMIAWQAPLEGFEGEADPAKLEEALVAADRAVAMYERLRAEDGVFTGALAVTNALMFGARAAEMAGDHDRRAGYAVRLASEEFESLRPSQGRYHDFWEAGRALRDAGRSAEAAAYFDEAEARMRAEGMGRRLIAIRRERAGVWEMEPGSPEKIAAVGSIWEAGDLGGFELALVAVGRELASDLLAAGESERAIAVLRQAEVMYEEAAATAPSEERGRAGARREYARVLTMRANGHAMRGEFAEAIRVMDKMIAAFPDAENVEQLIEDRERLLAEAAEAAEARAGEGAGAGE